MGSVNQLEIIRRQIGDFSAPHLEVGSKAYDDVDRVRMIFANEKDFVGIDMLEGENVDFVIDLTRPFAEVDDILQGKRFRSIYCLSVLEHCDNPFLMAENLSRLLADDGVLYVSVPHAWKFHGYPSDYWRFTHEGIKKLFPDLSFAENESWVSTDVENDIQLLADSDLGRVRIKGSYYRKQGRYLTAFFVGFLALLAKPFSRKIMAHRYFYPPVMIDMIGRKVAKS